MTAYLWTSGFEVEVWTGLVQATVWNCFVGSFLGCGRLCVSFTLALVLLCSGIFLKVSTARGYFKPTGAVR